MLKTNFECPEFLKSCHFSIRHEITQAIVTKCGKISAQPHPTLCIQFLNRENNTFPLGEQICFTIVRSCAETLPQMFTIQIKKEGM